MQLEMIWSNTPGAGKYEWGKLRLEDLYQEREYCQIQGQLNKQSEARGLQTDK